MRFTMNANGVGTAQLLSQSGTNSDANGILNWKDVFKPFGEFRDDISQLRLKQTQDPGDTQGDIIGTIKIDPNDVNLLEITMDSATFPTMTQQAVDAVIDPQANVPGDGTLAPAASGQRYLLTKSTAGGAGWGGVGLANDIIEYDGANWIVTFDAISNGSTEQFVTNTLTMDRLKYNGTSWINAFEGTYNPGFWRIYL